jgi:hypothetical protein
MPPSNISSSLSVFRGYRSSARGQSRSGRLDTFRERLHEEPELGRPGRRKRRFHQHRFADHIDDLKDLAGWLLSKHAGGAVGWLSEPG